MEVRSKIYTYRTSLKWTERKMGMLSSPGKPNVQVSTPPEFKGHEGGRPKISSWPRSTCAS